ncbi:hypothetical protein J6590_023928 [Homalodisca vitripennis]|nr:hypothetical protein J6590_099033 [Homalodisca vitripennis]KAG8268548.1 hypothetical protein J6590_023928 [Homalodisca vitripennis]
MIVSPTDRSADNVATVSRQPTDQLIRRNSVSPTDRSAVNVATASRQPTDQLITSQQRLANRPIS